MEYEKTIVLREPIQLTKDGPVIEELKLEEPTAGQLERMAQKTAASNEVAGINQLISDVSGVAMPFINKIRATEWTEAKEFLLGFIKTGQ